MFNKVLVRLGVFGSSTSGYILPFLFYSQQLPMLLLCSIWLSSRNKITRQTGVKKKRKAWFSITSWFTRIWGNMILIFPWRATRFDEKCFAARKLSLVDSTSFPNQQKYKKSEHKQVLLLFLSYQSKQFGVIDSYWALKYDLKQTILDIKSCSSNVLHEILENSTTINASLLNSKFIHECHTNLQKNSQQQLFRY